MSLTKRQEELSKLLHQIYEDGVMDDAEHEKLRAAWNGTGMTTKQVVEVVETFVAAVWDEVIEDGVVDDAEKTKLRNIVDGLRLPPDMIPPSVADVLK